MATKTAAKGVLQPATVGLFWWPDGLPDRVNHEHPARPRGTKRVVLSTRQVVRKRSTVLGTLKSAENVPFRVADIVSADTLGVRVLQRSVRETRYNPESLQQEERLEQQFREVERCDLPDRAWRGILPTVEAMAAGKQWSGAPVQYDPDPAETVYAVRMVGDRAVKVPVRAVDRVDACDLDGVLSEVTGETLADAQRIELRYVRLAGDKRGGGSPNYMVEDLKGTPMQRGQVHLLLTGPVVHLAAPEWAAIVPVLRDFLPD